MHRFAICTVFATIPSLRRATTLAVSTLCAVALGGGCGGGNDMTKLEPGASAPTWELPGSDGETHRLSDHRGERTVVLAWFPKAFTGG